MLIAVARSAIVAEVRTSLERGVDPARLAAFVLREGPAGLDGYGMTAGVLTRGHAREVARDVCPELAARFDAPTPPGHLWLLVITHDRALVVAVDAFGTSSEGPRAGDSRPPSS
jgi:hypothetical protein